ncbi:uncharacterized protein LOC121328785 [Polyodon spathula]|uniref:uncharacterized protein LOC121328785 n=1 Tax=Polyodon spathula TaxID=7913 RepID=UPI001B7E1479|nr:uncharacterized protein LOC121328785 [Polyodon spathula]
MSHYVLSCFQSVLFVPSDMENKNKSGQKRKQETHDEGEVTEVLKTEKDATPLLSARAIGAKKREPCGEVDPDGKPGKEARKKEEEEESSPKPRKRKFEDESSEVPETKIPKKEPQEGVAKGPRSRDRTKGRRPNRTQSDSVIGRQAAATSVQVFQNRRGKDMEDSPGGAKVPDVILKQDPVITYSKVLRDPPLILGLRAEKEDKDLTPNTDDPRRGPAITGTQG